jgi:hypothetical protein
MTNNLLQIKIKERLNKLASLDYDNFECWQIVEAFNKAQLEWVRRQINGVNAQNHGDGSSKVNYDDLQKLIVTTTIGGQNFPNATPPSYVTNDIPSDYLNFNGLYAIATSSCCPDDRNIIIYMVDKEDLYIILRDKNKQPNFEWGETVAVMSDDTFTVYTDGDFSISRLDLTYYRKPIPISFAGCVDISTGLATPDVPCEFKDDIAEILVDNAVAILAADIESFNQYNRATTSVQNNT